MKDKLLKKQTKNPEALRVSSFKLCCVSENKNTNKSCKYLCIFMQYFYDLSLNKHDNSGGFENVLPVG